MDDNKSQSSNLPIILGVIVVLAVIIIGGAVLLMSQQNNENGQEKELDKVKLQLKWVKQAQFAGYIMADTQGFYKDEGIEVEIQPGGVGIDPIQNLISDDVDIAVAWTGNTLPAVTQGEKIVNIGQGMQRSGMRLMAKKTSGIEKPKDIKGKKIGVWPGGNELEPYAFIEKQGYDKDNDVDIKSQDFNMNQLLNDEIDLASAMIYNEYYLPMNTGEYEESDFTVFDLEEEKAGMLQDALFVKQEYLEENKDLLVRFLRASIKGWDYAIKNQEQTIDDLGIDFTENEVMARDHQIRSIGEVVKLYTADDAATQGLFYISREKLQQTVDIAETYVEEVHDINIDDIYTLEIWEEATKDMEATDYSEYLG